MSWLRLLIRRYQEKELINSKEFEESEMLTRIKVKLSWSGSSGTLLCIKSRSWSLSQICETEVLQTAFICEFFGLKYDMSDL